jgi:hypothetical protein
MTKISYMMIAMAGLALTACSDDIESTFGNDTLAVKFTANVGTASRSANDYITNGATVKISNGGQYFGYVAGDDGNLTPTDGDFIRWSSMSQGSMAITAFTPATYAASNSSFTIAADQSSAAALAAADYATFDGTVSRLANSNNVSFELTRQLAQVNINIASVDKRYTDTDDDKFTFDVTVFSPSTTVTDGVGDGKALEVTPYSSSATASTAIIAAGQADDTAKFLAVQVNKNGIAVGNPLIARGRPVLEAGNSYTINLSVLNGEVAISSIQLTDWVTIDTIVGGHAIKEIPKFVVNLQDYRTEKEARDAICKYYTEAKDEVYVVVVGALNDWQLPDVLGTLAMNDYDGEYDSDDFSINYLDLDGITDLTELQEGCLASASSLKWVSATQVTKLSDVCFTDCTNLTDLNLPSVKEVGSSVFQNCTSLKKISLPRAIDFDDYVFENCTALIKVSIPQASTFGGNGNIFSGCKTEKIKLTINEFLAEFVSGNTWAYKTPAGLQKFNYTFKSITFDNSLYLEDYSSVASLNSKLGSCTNVSLIGELNGWSLGKIFTSDLSVTNINLDGVTDLTSIPYECFLNRDKIEKVSASQVIFLLAYSFAECYALTTVDYPSVIEVYNQAFSSDTSLAYVSLPVATAIDDNAFEKCTALQTVYIPKATALGKDIFSGCNTGNIDITLNESFRESVTDNTLTYSYKDKENIGRVYQYTYTFKSITFE